MPRNHKTKVKCWQQYSKGGEQLKNTQYLLKRASSIAGDCTPLTLDSGGPVPPVPRGGAAHEYSATKTQSTNNANICRVSMSSHCVFQRNDTFYLRLLSSVPARPSPSSQSSDFSLHRFQSQFTPTSLRKSWSVVFFRASDCAHPIGYTMFILPRPAFCLAISQIIR